MSQNYEQLRTGVFDILKTLAPEIDPTRIIGDKPLRTQIDLDSMDWLNVLAAIHDKLGVNIPETDYGKVVTLDGILAYLADKARPANAG
ncbi:acyl carrier protein [Dechloromonas sp. A34]|uniref:acyl carrier protein n=1 Tax=Dechloromonas sp. A34 TaxID=447588 RepID=UPI00224979A8|nr:acyl carrier protein [Dechloromonas sp. A34]